MTGQRLIVQNRIPRVRLPNRGIATPLDVWSGGSSAAGGDVGVIRAATALPSGPGVWQDATVPFSAFKMSDYPALIAANGPLTGSIAQNPQNAQVTAYIQNFSVSWKGAIYGSYLGVRKKTSAFGPYGTNLYASAQQMFPFTGPDMGPQNSLSPRLFLVTSDANPFGYIQTVTDDTTATAPFLLGQDATPNPYQPWVGFDTGVANTYIVLSRDAGPIWRTTNGGTAWTAISMAQLGVRMWCGIWRSGGTLYMIAQTMVITTSVDNGQTWTVPTTPANAGSINVSTSNGAQYVPFVAFDWATRKGYVIDQTGRLLQFDLDNPTAAYVVVLAAASFNTSQVRFAYTSTGIWYATNYNFTPKPGIWFAPFSSPTAWRSIYALASIPVSNQPNPQVSAMASLAVEAFGVLDFQNNNGSASLPSNWTSPDLVNTSDRWTVLDPGFLGGRKPYIRVS